MPLGFTATVSLCGSHCDKPDAPRADTPFGASDVAAAASLDQPSRGAQMTGLSVDATRSLLRLRPTAPRLVQGDPLGAWM